MTYMHGLHWVDPRDKMATSYLNTCPQMEHWPEYDNENPFASETIREFLRQLVVIIQAGCFIMICCKEGMEDGILDQERDVSVSRIDWGLRRNQRERDITSKEHLLSNIYAQNKTVHQLLKQRRNLQISRKAAKSLKLIIC